MGEYRGNGLKNVFEEFVSIPHVSITFGKTFVEG